jgi:hypothetical protein
MTRFEDWYAGLTPTQRLATDRALVARGKAVRFDSEAAAVGIMRPNGIPAPEAWREWATTLFERHFYHPFGRRHEEFWGWAWRIERDSSPPPFVAVWPRESGKSTNAEAVVTALGCRGKRKYALYVRATQKAADDSVANIAALLESTTVTAHYPEHADRLLSKFGQSRGWRRNRLRTAGGFTVDALGLDTNVRGVKIEEHRPDLIVLDDIDEKLDGPHITQKKIDVITHAILPAGARNVAVIAIQNLIIPNGIFSQLADGRADFLADRQVSGPFPAVEALKYEWRADENTGVRRAVITGGRATWEGQNLEACQAFINRWGLSAFLKEAQHKVKERAEGVVLRFRPHATEGQPSHYIDLTDDEVRVLVAQALRSKRMSLFGGIDFGAYRFAFTLWLVTGPDAAKALRRPDVAPGVVIRLDEYFAQRLPGEASLSERAQGIHELLEFYDVPLEQHGARSASDARQRPIPIWGDAANPTDILELNLAFRRGWDVEEQDDSGRVTRRAVKSRLRVAPVKAENKLRKTSVERLNDLLDRNAIRFRRAVGYEWRFAAGAASEGTPIVGSRFVWEMENWSYPVPKPGEAQKQDPDDHTADGADMIASARYAVMSWWSPTALPAELGHYPDDRARPFDYRRGDFREAPHAAHGPHATAARPPGRSLEARPTMAGLLRGTTRTPRVRMPRPRGT